MSWFDKKPNPLQAERDALSEKVADLQEQNADLLRMYSALGEGYAKLEGLAKRALALLLEVDTTRSGGIALFRKRTDLLREATAAGLLEEKKGEESE